MNTADIFPQILPAMQRW